ncbi:unnamed protein product [Orchesella dallaii]|uniref:Uncharacterized protein n=1 Tax=Orchesella dallaii TaxID=48710 RepID=A0ABP1QR09_9HEXA
MDRVMALSPCRSLEDDGHDGHSTHQHIFLKEVDVGLRFVTEKRISNLNFKLKLGGSHSSIDVKRKLCS